jgi:hypothetical protein
MLMKPGPAISTLSAVSPEQRADLLGHDLGHCARRHAGRLGRDERNVGGPVAVRGVTRALDGDNGYLGEPKPAARDRRRNGVGDGRVEGFAHERASKGWVHQDTIRRRVAHVAARQSNLPSVSLRRS